MRRDRAKVLARRRAQSRRRGAIATLAFLGTTGLWGFVAFASAPAWAAWVAVATSTLFGSSVVAGMRAARAYAEQDERLIPVATEVMVAATAAGAIQRVSTERAVGRRVLPTPAETQAIRALLSEAALAQNPTPGRVRPRDGRAENLVPGASPAQVPAPELPGIAHPAIDDPSWTPNTMPVPSYTLKPSAKPGTARPISEEDLAAGARAAEEAVDRRIAEREAERERSAPAASASVAARAAGARAAEQRAGHDGDPQPATATLDAILARRRRQSA